MDHQPKTCQKYLDGIVTITAEYLTVHIISGK